MSRVFRDVPFFGYNHNDIQTTMRYTHVSNLKIEKIESPFDQLHLKKDNVMPCNLPKKP